MGLMSHSGVCGINVKAGALAILGVAKPNASSLTGYEQRALPHFRQRPRVSKKKRGR